MNKIQLLLVAILFGLYGCALPLTPVPNYTREGATLRNKLNDRKKCDKIAKKYIGYVSPSATFTGNTSLIALFGPLGVYLVGKATKLDQKLYSRKYNTCMTKLGYKITQMQITTQTNQPESEIYQE